MNCKIPLFSTPVPAGFPSSADDFVEDELDLNQFLIKQKDSTFFIRVNGDSMINAGIFAGDILIVDRSIKEFQEKIVVAVLDGDFTIKRFVKRGNRICLLPENKDYQAIDISSASDFEVWGVVTTVIHNVNN